MRTRDLLKLVGLALVASMAFGCSEKAGESADGDSPQDESTPPPEFPEGQGQPIKGTIAFPAGPYGIGKGSVIRNYAFVGYADASTLTDEGAVAEIELADFYNPTCDGVFEEGSPYGEGNPKPQALMINVSAFWCPPCKEEAKSVLPGKYEEFKPQGGEFLMQLAEDEKYNTADAADLYRWTSKYDVNFPATIDPTRKLSALFDANAFPANLIVDTRTMKIVEVVAGAPSDDFWEIFQDTIDDQSACGSSE